MKVVRLRHLAPLLLILTLPASIAMAQSSDFENGVFLRSVFFEHDQADVKLNKPLPFDSIRSLKLTIDSIALKGYSSNVGAEDYNLNLAENRIESVYKSIQSSGLPVSRMKAYGAVPGSEASETLEAKSRRVDVLVYYTVPKKEEITPPDQPIPPVTPEPEPHPVPEPDPGPSAEELESKRIEELLAHAESGQLIRLEALTFEGGMATLLEGSDLLLPALANALKTHDTLLVEIRGHICCEYENFDGINMATGSRSLSVDRANMVYDYLVNAGIPESRLVPVGYGNSKPLDGPEWQNRRVELYITDERTIKKLKRKNQ